MKLTFDIPDVVGQIIAQRWRADHNGDPLVLVSSTEALVIATAQTLLRFESENRITIKED